MAILGAIATAAKVVVKAAVTAGKLVGKAVSSVGKAAASGVKSVAQSAGKSVAKSAVKSVKQEGVKKTKEYNDSSSKSEQPSLNSALLKRATSVSDNLSKQKDDKGGPSPRRADPGAKAMEPSPFEMARKITRKARKLATGVVEAISDEVKKSRRPGR